MGMGINVVQDGSEVVVVQLSRPPDNAFTLEMCAALTDVLSSPPKGAHLLRIRGEEGVFCRGREPAAGGPEAAQATVAGLTAVTRALGDSNLVTLAEVDGDAAGFGVGLAALCDVTVASERARFWFPEVAHDRAPALVLSWLPRVVGRRQAFWLTATGERLDALSARDLGLVNLVCSPERLGQQVEEIVTSLLRYQSAVHAEIKRDIRDFETLDPAAVSTMASDRLVMSTVIAENGQN